MDIRNNSAEQRFEIEVDGRLAKLEYRERPGEITFTHTDVPTESEGEGVGSELARAGLEYAREKGLKAIPRCSFVASYLERHPELAS